MAPLKPAVAANDEVAPLGFPGPSGYGFQVNIAIEGILLGWGYDQSAVGGGLRYCGSERGMGHVGSGRLWGGAVSSGSPRMVRGGDRGVRRAARGRQGAGWLKGWWEQRGALPPASGTTLAGRLAALPCCCAAQAETAREGGAGARHWHKARAAGRQQWRQQRQPSSVCTLPHQLAACCIHEPQSSTFFKRVVIEPSKTSSPEWVPRVERAHYRSDGMGKVSHQLECIHPPTAFLSSWLLQLQIHTIGQAGAYWAQWPGPAAACWRQGTRREPAGAHVCCQGPREDLSVVTLHLQRSPR